MVAVNPPGPTGFGPTAGPVNPDGVPFLDTVDGIPSLGPTFNPAGGLPPPSFAQAIINPAIVSDVAGIPSQNQIIIELRVISNLLLMMMGAMPGNTPDLTQMRADEFWNTNLQTGVN